MKPAPSDLHASTRREHVSARDNEARSPYIDIDVDRARFRVRRDVYIDPQVLKAEQTAIFDRCWLYLAHESELARPGDFVTRNVGGRNLLATCGKDGEVHAFLNICTHRGSIVCREERGQRKTFSCPYHGWVFDLAGQLKDTNAKAGYRHDIGADGGLDLSPVPRLEQYRGFWFVNFDAGAESLFDYLAEAKDYIDLMVDQAPSGLEVIKGEQAVTCHGNWKMIPENFVDSYHVAILHRSYLEYAKDRVQFEALQAGTQGEAGGLGNGHTLMDNTAPLGRPIAMWIPAWGEEVRPKIEALKADLVERFGEERADIMATRTRNVIVFPNTIFGDGLSISVRTVNPAGPDKMVFTSWPIAPKDEDPDLRRLRIDNYLTFTGPGGFATPDDMEVWHLCQKAAHLEGQTGWNELSRGFDPDQDLLTVKDDGNNEAQLRAWWRQYDILMGSGAKDRPA